MPDDSIVRIDVVVSLVHLKHVTAFVLWRFREVRVKHGAILKRPVKCKQINPTALFARGSNEFGTKPIESRSNLNVHVGTKAIPVDMLVERSNRSIRLPAKCGDWSSSPVDSIL
jgi:hypothetical protein